MAPAYALIDKLSRDHGMRDEWREMAYEFYREHQDAQPTFEEMMKQIKERL
jgi:hypothetical protein